MVRTHSAFRALHFRTPHHMGTAGVLSRHQIVGSLWAGAFLGAAIM